MSVPFLKKGIFTIIYQKKNTHKLNLLFHLSTDLPNRYEPGGIKMHGT